MELRRYDAVHTRPVEVQRQHRSSQKRRSLRVLVEKLRLNARPTWNPYHSETVISGRGRCTRSPRQSGTAIGLQFEFGLGMLVRAICSTV